MNSAFSVIKAEYQTNQTAVAAAIWLSFTDFFFWLKRCSLSSASMLKTPGNTEVEEKRVSTKCLLFMSSFYSDLPPCDSSYLGLMRFHADECLEWGSAVGFVHERDKEMTLKCLHRKCQNTKVFHARSDSQGQTHTEGCRLWARITWLRWIRDRSWS